MTKFEKSVGWAMASTALEFSDEVVAKTDIEILATMARIKRGETTLEEEENKLLQEWRELKNNNLTS